MGSGLHSCRTVDVKPKSPSTGSRSLEHYPLHLPCQHLNEGDDDANAHDPLATYEARSCHGHLLIPLWAPAHDDELSEPSHCCRGGDVEGQVHGSSLGRSASTGRTS